MFVYVLDVNISIDMCLWTYAKNVNKDVTISFVFKF